MVRWCIFEINALLFCLFIGTLFQNKHLKKENPVDNVTTSVTETVVTAEHSPSRKRNLEVKEDEESHKRLKSATEEIETLQVLPPPSPRSHPLLTFS
jgi:hypothetical protein